MPTLGAAVQTTSPTGDQESREAPASGEVKSPPAEGNGAPPQKTDAAPSKGGPAVSVQH
jgi:hypothetical protein